MVWKSSRTRIYLISFNLAMLFLIHLGVLLDYNSWLKVSGVVYFVTFLVNLMGLKKICGSYLDFFIIIYIVSFLLHLSQIYLGIMNLDNWQNTLTFFSKNTNVKAFTFSFDCIHIMVISYLIFYKTSHEVKKVDVSMAEKSLIRILAISFYCLKILININMIVKSLSGGYLTALESMGNLSDLISTIANVMVIMYLHNCTEPKKKRRIFVFIVLMESIFMLSGSRIYVACFLLTLFISEYPTTFTKIGVKSNDKINTKKKQKLLPIIILIVLCLSLFVGIRYARENGQSITIISVIEEAINHNIILEVIKEFGGTQLDTLVAINYENEINYQYGKTYIDSFLTILPNIGGIFDEQIYNLHFVNYLYDLFFWNYGGSYVCEAFMNFGYMGSLVFVFIGYLFAIIEKLFSLRDSRSTIFNIFVLLLCYTSFLWTRAFFYGLLRRTIWISFGYWIIKTILISKNNNSTWTKINDL